MKKILSIFLLAACVLWVHAEDYSIVFQSNPNGDGSATSDWRTLMHSATCNMVVGTTTMNKIAKAKPGFGIKGGTTSLKGELTILLDTAYAPTTLTVYAATFPHAKDTAAGRGMMVCGQKIEWEDGHKCEIRPYTITLTAPIDSITLSSVVASYNRFYVQKIEFSCPDPMPTHAKLEMPYAKRFGSIEIDSTAVEDVDLIPIEGKDVNASGISLSFQKGTIFSVENSIISRQGEDVPVSYRATYAQTFTDTLIVSASGADNQLVTRRIPLSFTAYRPGSGGGSHVDSTCMHISVQPRDYYDSIVNLTDSALKTHLGALIHCGVRLTYGSGNRHTWEGFYKTDRDSAGLLVLDMYSNETRYFDSLQPTASVANMDIEHMLPKSWWGGNVNDAYKDLFHLVPADYSANRSKSNIAPGNITADTTFWNGSFACGINPDYPVDRVFCPADEYKGDFARAYFYIATCYEDFKWVEDESSDAAVAMQNNNWQEFAPWLRDVLLQWHRMDPVSPKEKKRAIAVNKIQGNRNPYIDYPELVEYIWGDRQGQVADFSALTCSFTPADEPNETASLHDNLQQPAATKRIENSQVVIIRNGIKYNVLGVAL